jgi:hypothetical protein
MGAMDLPQVDCPTWDQLLLEFRKLRAWAFRGHSSAKWALESTLERRNPGGADAFFTEFNAVQQFLMQHFFGAPTRT